MHLARLPEADAALQAALELEPRTSDVLANRVVWGRLVGRSEAEVAGWVEGLRRVDVDVDGRRHGLMGGLEEAERRFELGMRRFGARVVEG